MAMLFTGPATSSPIRKRQPFTDESCQSPGLSLLSSPDSSYECYSVNPLTGSPCSCRRSARLLSNGYYVLTEDSYAWDDEGNLTLTPSKINVSYKENLVRVFRRRRRARRSLASLLCDVTETCQSWLDQRVFGGRRPAPLAPPTPLAQSSWLEDSTTPDLDTPDLDTSDLDTPDLDTSCSFTYDHSEVTAPPGKLDQETVLQKEVCTETCHSQEQFGQSLGGLLDVPPPSAFHAHSLPEPQPADCARVKALFLVLFSVFLFTAVLSRCLMWGMTMAVTTFMLITTSLFFTKCGPMGRWRTAKTEVITSGNE